MIIKSFELNKINFKSKYFFLLYGVNQGHKNQIIEEKFKKSFSENIYYYDENEILNNEDNFFNKDSVESLLESLTTITESNSSSSDRITSEIFSSSSIQGIIIDKLI